MVPVRVIVCDVLLLEMEVVMLIIVHLVMYIMPMAILCAKNVVRIVTIVLLMEVASVIQLIAKQDMFISPVLKCVGRVLQTVTCVIQMERTNVILASASLVMHQLYHQLLRVMVALHLARHVPLVKSVMYAMLVMC